MSDADGKRGRGRPRKTGPSRREGLVAMTLYVAPETAERIKVVQRMWGFDSRGQAVDYALGNALRVSEEPST